jgi:hypothetical protein
LRPGLIEIAPGSVNGLYPETAENPLKW